MRLPLLSKSPRVYVDAKILNMHLSSPTRSAYVGYLVEGSGKKGAKEVQATESDDAEIEAILFAIEELKGLGRFTIVCDHESVVSEATRDSVKNPSPLMVKLRDVLHSNNRTVRLEVLKANPAHGVVTEFVNRIKSNPA